MDAPYTIAVLVGIGLLPFLALWWVLRRGSAGGRVRSLGSRRKSGRAVNVHASMDRFDAAKEANTRQKQNSGVVTRLRRRIARSDE